MISEYEKEIRIDQHQISRKGTKLKLESNKAVLTDNATQSALQSKPVDAAMEELYACLGDAAVNPLTLENDAASSSVNETTVRSKGKVKETGKKASQSSPETPSAHEIRRRELIQMFPTMSGTDSMNVDVESVDFFPNNAIPSKKSYRISIEALEYYSVYDTQHHYHYENQGHRNWNRNDSWNPSRNARWGSNTDDSNWRSRDNSYSSYGFRERDNRWQQSRSQRDSHAMWREDRNGRWDTPNDSNWRRRNDPEFDRRFSDSYGGSEYDTGFRESYRDSPQRHNEDQIDYSVWPEWKKKRRRHERQQGREKYPSCIVKVSWLCF